MKVYFYKRSLEILEFEAKSWLSLRPGICVAHFLRKGRSRREARREEGRRGRGELLVLFSTIGLQMDRVKKVINKLRMMMMDKRIKGLT